MLTVVIGVARADAVLRVVRRRIGEREGSRRLMIRLSALDLGFTRVGVA